MKTRHDSNCTIYTPVNSGNSTDGICTCGYAHDKLWINSPRGYSVERCKEIIKRPTVGKELAAAIRLLRQPSRLVWGWNEENWEHGYYLDHKYVGALEEAVAVEALRE